MVHYNETQQKVRELEKGRKKGVEKKVGGDHEKLFSSFMSFKSKSERERAASAGFV
jgi:hypothetical protein